MDTPPIPYSDQPWATAAAPLGVTSQPDPMPMASAPPSFAPPDAEMTPDAQGDYQNPQMDMTHPNVIEGMAAGVHHNRLARMLSNVGDLLGGGTSYKLIENPDGTVDVHPQQATGAEKIARIAQAAVQGLAHGWAAGQGPGGAARALAAGVDTGTQLAAQRQKESRELAKEYTTQNRQKMLFDANMKLMTINTAKAIYSLDHEKQQDIQANDDRIANINAQAKAVHAEQHIFDNQRDLAAAYMDPNSGLNIAEQEHRVNLYHVPVPGKPDRVIVNVTPKDQMTELYKPDWTPQVAKRDPNDPSKGIWYEPGETIIGGHNTVEQHNALVQQQENANMTVKQQQHDATVAEEQRKLEKQKTEAAIRASDASAASNRADAGYKTAAAKVQGRLLANMPGGGMPDAPPDLENPAPSYFAQGTSGIEPYDNPKAGTYRRDRDLENKEVSSNIVIDNAAMLNRLFKRDPTTGKPMANQDLVGQWNAVRDRVKEDLTGLGSSQQDQDLAALGRIIENISQAAVNVHGRNAALVKGSMKDTINYYLNAPEALLASVDKAVESARGVKNQAVSYRLYGNPNGGPSREEKDRVIANWYQTHGQPVPAPVAQRLGTTGQSKAGEPSAPQGATYAYHDKNGNLLGWAVNNQFVPVNAAAVAK